MTVNRREAMGLFAGAGALLALTGCSAESATQSAGPADSVRVSATTPVAALEESVRDLRLRLWAEPSTAMIRTGLTTDVYSFGAEVIDGDPASIAPSASYLGPTLHFRTGQRVRVTFENRLPDESIVHWHGLVVPQDQDGQPAEAVPSGGTYEYDFVVDNQPGTYWYHPHPHGRTGEQVYRGLAGLLIVHGDEPALPSGDNDLALVLQDRTIAADGELRYVSGMHDQMAGFVGSELVTNGVTDLAIEVRREPYRIRLLNGANSRTQYLSWSTGDPIVAVATDGHLLPDAVTVDGLVITPAQRTDLWVDFSEFEPGHVVELLSADTFIEARGMMGGGMNNEDAGADEGAANTGSGPRVAASFVVTDSESIPGDAPTALGEAPSFGVGDAVNASSPKQFTLSTRQGRHLINDTSWEGRVASTVEETTADEIEVWEFVSQSPIPHPMHLHGKPFRVLDRSWDDESVADAWAEIEHGVIETGLRDTVLVWPGQRVRIVVPFAAHQGYFLYHCHILEHEDAGMMRNFLVS